MSVIRLPCPLGEVNVVNVPFLFPWVRVNVVNVPSWLPLGEG